MAGPTSPGGKSGKLKLMNERSNDTPAEVEFDENNSPIKVGRGSRFADSSFNRDSTQAKMNQNSMLKD